MKPNINTQQTSMNENLYKSTQYIGLFWESSNTKKRHLEHESVAYRKVFGGAGCLQPLHFLGG